MAQVTTRAAHPDFTGAVNYSEAAIYFEDAVAGSGSDTVVVATLPANSRLLRGSVHIEELFNAGSTNVLIVGDADDDDHFLASGDVNEGATGTTAFASNTPKKYTAEKEIRMKYSYTGTTPTTGIARCWIEWVRLGM